MSTWRRRAALDAWIVRTEELLRESAGPTDAPGTVPRHDPPEPTTRCDDAA